YILEKNDSFGRETSSRNSQVIHSGIFYPRDSLKAKLCLEGNASLYSICTEHGIGHLRTGKLVVAGDGREVEGLEILLQRGRENGVDGLRLLDLDEIKEVEPDVRAIAALLVPSAGVVDAYGLMGHFLAVAKEKGARVAYRSKVVGIERWSSGFMVTIEDVSGPFSFAARAVINCAGLNCDRIAALAGIDVVQAGYELHYCKGEYFAVKGSKAGLVHRLIYPVPRPRGAGLGVHITLDLEGRMLLGPSSEYVDEVDYRVDPEHRQMFYESAVKYLLVLDADDLEPEMAGIRPTLQAAEAGFTDFIIRDEADKGLPGLVNLIGIESPGLTSAPAIGRYVAGIVGQVLGA
ncbi:MAG: NAD(P)/FAD-dependent oxidoreductase, partial [Dehalococcoidia bacterium]|nr:NAD(P)/FAD-dependent oxidoreductase [Dehalococcoidia bacterium]